MDFNPINFRAIKFTDAFDLNVVIDVYSFNGVKWRTGELSYRVESIYRDEINRAWYVKNSDIVRIKIKELKKEINKTLREQNAKKAK